MTHETDGGRVMSRRRSDETLLTLRDGVIKHFTSALAVISSAAEHKQRLVASFVEFKQAAVSGKHAGKFQRVVIESDDIREIGRLAEHLNRSGIKFMFAEQNWTQTAHSYWTGKRQKKEFLAGSLVIDMAQPQGPLAKALLEPMSDFEKDFVERQKAKLKSDREGKRDPVLDSFEFYDSTAWSLPYAYNLEAWWCESAPKLKTETGYPLVDVAHAELSPVGYWLEYRDQEDILYVASVLQAGVKVGLTTRESKVGGETIPAGSFLFLKARNEEKLEDKLFPTDSERVVNMKALKTSYPDSGRQGPGSENVVQLRKPKVAVQFGSAGSLSGGSLWYLLENEFRLPFSGMTSNLSQDIGTYTCLVIPSGSVSGRALEFANSGGTVVLLNGSHGVGEGDIEEIEADVDLPGAFFRAKLDRLHYLTYGYRQKEISVPIDGSRFVKTSESNAPVRLPDSKTKKLLSGWAWDSTDEDIAKTTWLYEVDQGRGKVIVFTQDPTFRAQYPGLYKLLLNAIILGPSM
ncbi:hypothetical protein QPK87_10835 [Kamptonema cortianum]|nr:hypothetical protein [Kamptonema cortianum]